LAVTGELLRFITPQAPVGKPTQARKFSAVKESGGDFRAEYKRGNTTALDG